MPNDSNRGEGHRRDVRVLAPADKPRFRQLAAALSFLQLEQNLDKAADLLDRIVRDRDEYRNLGARAIWLDSDADEDATNQAQRARMGDAYFDKIVEHAKHLHDAASTNASTADAVYTGLGTSTLSTHIDPVEESQAEALLAYLGALPTREADYHDEAHHNDLVLGTGGQFKGQANFQQKANLPNKFAPAPPPTIPVEAQFTKTILTFSTAQYQSQRVLQRVLDALSIQKAQAQGESIGNKAGDLGSAHSREEAQQAVLDWTLMDQAYQKVQADARAAAWQAKRSAIDDPNGLLNFTTMQASVLARINQDWGTVTDRLAVVQTGLATLFGFAFGSYDSIDAATLAVRDAIEFINRVTLRDQNVVIPLNLRLLMAPTAWNAGLATGQFAFDVDEGGLLASLQNVRLRGLSAVINSPHSGQLWSVRVTLPSDTWSRHGDEEVVDFTQTLPLCLLNRVTSFDAIRDPDLMGTTSLYNASPFGQWNVTVEPVDPTSADAIADIQDFRIDLLLAAQAYPLPLLKANAVKRKA